MLALCLMFSEAYYSHNYAGLIGLGVPDNLITSPVVYILFIINA